MGLSAAYFVVRYRYGAAHREKPKRLILSRAEALSRTNNECVCL